MTPEEVTYLAVLLGSIPVGFLLRDRGPRWRQFGGAGLGAGLALVTCGPHVLHSLLTALGTWALLRALPRRCGGAALLWTFGYLLFFRTPELWGLPPPPPYANALQLLLTLKMVSLASDVQELLEQGPGRWEEGQELLGCLQSPPGLLELLCYTYCYLGLLTGPFYRLSTHRDWVRGPLPRVGALRVLRWVRWVPALAALGEGLSRCFPLALARGEALRALPLPQRLLLPLPLFGAFRLRFYVGWSLAEASCVAAALGGYPARARPSPGRGPERPWPRPSSVPPEEHWDFQSIRTTDPGGTERCRGVGEGLRRWNMSVQWWMANYVHRRTPPWAPPLRAAFTMLVSAFWHGLHPGYYLSFLSIPLWLAAERALPGGGWGSLLGEKGEGRVPSWLRGVLGGLGRLVPMRVFEYLSMGFVLREAEATLAFWGSLGFYLHLLPLLLLLGAKLGGWGRGKGRGEGVGEPPRAHGGGEREGNPGEGLRKRREKLEGVM